MKSVTLKFWKRSELEAGLKLDGHAEVISIRPLSPKENADKGYQPGVLYEVAILAAALALSGCAPVHCYGYGVNGVNGSTCFVRERFYQSAHIVDITRDEEARGALAYPQGATQQAQIFGDTLGPIGSVMEKMITIPVK